MKTFSFLALGDSYTIGEQVPLAESFPYQAVQFLRKAGIQFTPPEIIAKTGWTTDELKAAMADTVFLPQYDVVSLLIGVNNQYRGRTADNFKTEFAELIAAAISFAKRQEKVFVLSIPDWGVTPFAAGKDVLKIASEIDQYNEICESISKKYGVRFIDITGSQRKDAATEGFLADDKLHPSGKEYKKWASQLANTILEVF